MPHKKAEPLTEDKVGGLKYFDKLMPMLHRLHGLGAERDKAGNRTRHFDHDCASLLLFLFNPIVTSLRGLQQASELKKVQNNLKSPTDGQSKSAYRLHTHFDIERAVPSRIDVTGGKNTGDDDEREVLRKHLQSDHC